MLMIDTKTRAEPTINIKHIIIAYGSISNLIQYIKMSAMINLLSWLILLNLKWSFTVGSIVSMVASDDKKAKFSGIKFIIDHKQNKYSKCRPKNRYYVPSLSVMQYCRTSAPSSSWARFSISVFTISLSSCPPSFLPDRRSAAMNLDWPLIPTTRILASSSSEAGRESEHHAKKNNLPVG